MKKKRKLPKRLYIIRHALSLANVKLAEAMAAGAEEFELPMPDHLAPIVDEGYEQIRDLAIWLSQLPVDQRPSKIVSSTHKRTKQTSEGLQSESGLSIPIAFDERLIEKKWGIVGGLTNRGFQIRFPQEAAKRVKQGDFRYRPIGGGESLRDAKNRVKPALKEQLAAHEDENLVLVTHSQMVLVLRQLIENLSEKETQKLDDSRKIPNCSVCVYLRMGSRLVLEHEYFVAPKAVS